MGLLGLTIVGALVAARPLSDKVSLTGQALANVNSAAQQIQLQSFHPCSPSNPQPYSLASAGLQGGSAAVGSLSISTNSLPIGQAPSSGLTHTYSAQLDATGGNGSFLWSVAPQLPTGLTLNSNGSISGTPTSESTGLFKFSVTSTGSTISKSLLLTIVSINVQVNDTNVAWSPCSTVPKATISGATATGSTITYTYSSTVPFSAGDTVTISGISPTGLNLVSVPIVSATSTQFVVASTVTGTYVSGGEVGLTESVNVQQIIVSTLLGSRQISRTIVAAI
jgi:hypothetical protein